MQIARIGKLNLTIKLKISVEKPIPITEKNARYTKINNTDAWTTPQRIAIVPDFLIH